MNNTIAKRALWQLIMAQVEEEKYEHKPVKQAPHYLIFVLKRYNMVK